MTVYIHCPGSWRPLKPERGRLYLEGICPACGRYVLVYTPTPGVPKWHATNHEAPRQPKAQP
jgi:hypothetical protein